MIGSLFLLVLVAGLAAGGVAFYGFEEFSKPGPLAANKIFEIDKGLGAPEIGAKLEEQGIIGNARIFSAGAYLTGGRSRLKAGEYEFQAKSSMQDVMNLLVSGKSIVYKVSIPEGWTSAMAVARLDENTILTGAIAVPPPEGSIMPDTYVFKRGMTRQKLVEDMQAAQTKLLDEVWAGHKTAIPLRTREQAVILASIVEKETSLADERPLIASVFMNRLNKHMRLQSDPTIIYGIVGGKGKLDHRLTKADITAPTPYNTYTIDGLPPGPIANPGRAALEAVVNPPDTSYLYFVADGTGGHAFASTLEEHNRNVAKWRDLTGNAASAAAAELDLSGQPAQAAATLPAIAPDSAVPVPDPKEAAAASGGTNAVPAAAAPAADSAKAAAGQTAPVEPKAEAKQPAATDSATAAPTPAADTAPANFKPGSVIKSGGQLIPIPRRKPKH